MFYENSNSCLNDLKNNFPNCKKLHIFEWINLLESDNSNKGSNCLKEAITEELKFLANKQIQSKFHFNDNTRITTRNKSNEEDFFELSTDFIGKLPNSNNLVKNPKITNSHSNHIPELVKNQNFHESPNFYQLRSLTKVNNNSKNNKKIHHLFGNLQNELSKKNLKI